MEPFIRTDQYNFNKMQTQHLVNGHTTVNDLNVLKALKSLVKEKVFKLFEELNEERTGLLEPIVFIQEKSHAEIFLEQIKQHVIPSQEVTNQTLKKLFPKSKKLKLPQMNYPNLVGMILDRTKNILLLVMRKNWLVSMGFSEVVTKKGYVHCAIIMKK